jgi:hypothetical protein
LLHIKMLDLQSIDGTALRLEISLNWTDEGLGKLNSVYASKDSLQQRNERLNK